MRQQGVFSKLSHFVYINQAVLIILLFIKILIFLVSNITFTFYLPNETLLFILATHS